MTLAIKICGLTRVQDVHVAIEAGADALGFVFDRGPCILSLTQAEDLLGALVRQRHPCLTVAVVGELSQERIAAIVNLGFDAVQAVESTYEAALAAQAPCVIPAFFDDDTLASRVRAFRSRLAPAFDRRQGLLGGCVNVDGRGGGGAGNLTNWQVAAELAKEGPLMLAGGLTAANVATAIATVQPAAVDVSSGVEAAPGVKDHAKMRAFVQAARAAANRL